MSRSCDAKFCILIDESRKEQMEIILRFVDCDGFIQECIFYIIYVQQALASNLKEKICLAISKHNIQIKEI